ncbi:MAG: DnaA regulatory inactivator Hda [Gammaproteobacteria bacterium]
MTYSPPEQLLLGVSLRDEATFDNFHVSQANSALLRSLTTLSKDDHLTYLWGAASSGRTHLAQALCHQQAESGLASLYLPLQEHESLAPDMLQGAEGLAMVCIDDVDAIAGETDWEQALFQLYNELAGTETRLVVTAACAPQYLPMQLKDLVSRLQSGAVYQLATPDDEEKRAILRKRAAIRGMDLSDQVADFVVQRAERSLQSLMSILDKLDKASLEKGRRITIPLIKEVLGW